MDTSPKDSQIFDNKEDSNVDIVEQESQTYASKKTKFSVVATVVFSGIALFSDGYNAQVIGYMNSFLSVLYPTAYTATLKGRVSNAYLIGEIIGMLGFGFIIDRFGRKFGIVACTTLLILGIIISTAAHGTTETGLLWMILVGRGISGVGAGGEYPVCGTGATEAADESSYVRKHRGFLIGLIGDFAIDSGFVVAGIVIMIVMVAYHQQFSSGVWRVSFGLGIVLPLFVFYFRLKMLNSTQYKKHAMQKHIPYKLVLKRYWKPMVGTALCWFMYDFVSYPFGLFSSTVIGNLNPNNNTFQNIGYGTVVNAFYLPGAFFGGYLMDKIGRKNTMMLGFFSQAVLGFILGGALPKIQPIFPLFVVLYGIFNSLGEVGPGVATILCASESFPTPIRGHFLGFAAAVGKAGAAIGTQVFTPMQNAIGGSDVLKGEQGVFLVGSAFSVVGGLIALFFIPNMSRSLEDEDRAFKQYLIENGYTHLEEMGLEEDDSK